MFGLGTTELLLIFGAALLLFGAKRLPALGRSLGEGIRGFRGAVSSVKEVGGEIEKGGPERGQ